jgi:FdhD protein
MATSACGVRGKASIEDVCVLPDRAVATDPARFAPEVLALLPERLRGAQWVFSGTGGLHAAGLFTANGELVIVREDVGRHNAVDKSLAVALAEEAGLTLVGFLRGPSMNVYAGAHRMITSPGDARR